MCLWLSGSAPPDLKVGPTSVALCTLPFAFRSVFGILLTIMRRTSSSSPAAHATAVTLLILSAACAGRAPASQPAGVLTIGVSTTGTAPTPAFAVAVSSTRPDAAAPRSDRVEPHDGIATFRGLSEGPYVVRLSLPPQCEAEGGASRSLTVTSRRTTAARFVVRCR